eukprot:168036_1
MSTIIQRRMDNDMLLVFGYVRLKSDSSVTIPNVIAELCFKFYHLVAAMLQFSSVYCSADGFELSNDNKHVKRVPAEASDGYRYILVDAVPVFTMEHCWRIKVDNPKGGWIVWGIAQQQKYETGRFVHRKSDGGAYGVTYYQQFYPDDSFSVNSQVRCEQFADTTCLIDLYLNADEGTMKLCVVGQLDGGEPRFHKLPTNTKKGWVPYFVFGTTPMGASLRVAKIPIEWYGLKDHNVFDDDDT